MALSVRGSTRQFVTVIAVGGAGCYGSVAGQFRMRSMVYATTWMSIFFRRHYASITATCHVACRRVARATVVLQSGAAILDTEKGRM